MPPNKLQYTPYMQPIFANAISHENVGDAAHASTLGRVQGKLLSPTTVAKQCDYASTIMHPILPAHTTTPAKANEKKRKR